MLYVWTLSLGGGENHSMYIEVSSAQVRLVTRGLGGPVTSVTRESCWLGEPSFFHVNAFNQRR